ncbi:hypothetical protein D1AOALGA4SA_12680 [Olavius algarvensis Delta 1 endosymbiont]|nr:hypothetical protein D1AOALGA4SA_12680 [Olavius algarvensis Delta 1 endosymbiont]
MQNPTFGTALNPTYPNPDFSCRHELVIYFVAENLVLWARSEPLGYAVNLLQAGAE